MNRIIYISFIFIILILTGCAQSVNLNSAVSINVNQRSGLNKFFKNYDYVRLETNDSSIISKIDRFEVNDSVISIQTRSKIVSFNMKGNCIGIIDHKGNATNEYIDINDFKLADDLVWILSTMQKRIKAYDMNGNLRKILELDNYYYAFDFLDDNMIVLSSENCNDSGYNFALIDKNDGKILDRFDKFEKDEGVILDKIYYPFIGKSRDNDFVICHPFETSTYTLTPDHLTQYKNYSFNTQDQINGGYGSKPFIELLDETENQPVVRTLSNFFSNDNYDLIAFPLFGEYGILYNLAKFEDDKQIAFSPILETIDKQFPYISSPFKIRNGKIVSCMQAGQIIYIENNNELSTFKSQGLELKDNPVVFFHTLNPK